MPLFRLRLVEPPADRLARHIWLKHIVAAHMLYLVSLASSPNASPQRETLFSGRLAVGFGVCFFDDAVLLRCVQRMVRRVSRTLSEPLARRPQRRVWPF